MDDAGAEGPALEHEVRRRARPVADVGHEMRIGPQMLGLPADPLGMRPVVGVLAGDEIALRLRERRVARDVGAAVARQADQPDARVALREFGDDLGGAVRARVVGHEDLEIAPGLARDRAQARADGVGAIESRHDHRDLHGVLDLRQGSRPVEIVDARLRGLGADDPEARRCAHRRRDRRDPVGTVAGFGRREAGGQQQEIGMGGGLGRGLGGEPGGLLDAPQPEQQRKAQRRDLGRSARALARGGRRLDPLERARALGRVPGFGAQQGEVERGAAAGLGGEVVLRADRLEFGDPRRAERPARLVEGARNVVALAVGAAPALALRREDVRVEPRHEGRRHPAPPRELQDPADRLRRAPARAPERGVVAFLEVETVAQRVVQDALEPSAFGLRAHERAFGAPPLRRLLVHPRARRRHLGLERLEPRLDQPAAPEPREQRQRRGLRGSGRRERAQRFGLRPADRRRRQPVARLERETVVARAERGEGVRDAGRVRIGGPVDQQHAARRQLRRPVAQQIRERRGRRPKIEMQQVDPGVGEAGRVRGVRARDLRPRPERFRRLVEGGARHGRRALGRAAEVDDARGPAGLDQPEGEGDVRGPAVVAQRARFPEQRLRGAGEYGLGRDVVLHPAAILLSGRLCARLAGCIAVSTARAVALTGPDGDREFRAPRPSGSTRSRRRRPQAGSSAGG